DSISYQSLAPFSRALKNLAVTFGPATPQHQNTLLVLVNSAVQNSNIVVDVLGSPGPDTVYLLAIADLSDSALVLRGDLGAGDDYVAFQAGRLVRSVVTNDLALGLGSNTLIVGPTLFPIDASTILTNAEGSSSATQKDEVRWYAAAPFTNGSRYVTNL